MPDSDFDELPFTSELPGPVAPAFAMAQHAHDSLPSAPVPVTPARLRALENAYVTAEREHKRAQAVLTEAAQEATHKAEAYHVARSDWERARARWHRQQVDNG